MYEATAKYCKLPVIGFAGCARYFDSSDCLFSSHLVNTCSHLFLVIIKFRYNTHFGWLKLYESTDARLRPSQSLVVVGQSVGQNKMNEHLKGSGFQRRPGC